MRARQSFPILHDNLTLHWYAECTWLFILKVHLRITNKPPTAKDSNTDLGRCRLTQSSVVLHVHGLLFSSSVLLFLFNFLYPLFILIPNFTPRSLSFFSLLFSHFKLDRGYWCIVWFYLRLSFVNVKWCIKYKSDSSTKRIKRYTLYTYAIDWMPQLAGGKEPKTCAPLIDFIKYQPFFTSDSYTYKLKVLFGLFFFFWREGGKFTDSLMTPRFINIKICF